jgi:hypothetical protein
MKLGLTQTEHKYAPEEYKLVVVPFGIAQVEMHWLADPFWMKVF